MGKNFVVLEPATLHSETFGEGVKLFKVPVMCNGEVAGALPERAEVRVLDQRVNVDRHGSGS